MPFPYSEQDTFIAVVDRHAASAASDEVTVPAADPYVVELTELPEVDSVTIPGLTEVGYMPTSSTEFFVNYGSASVYFHSAQASATHTISYSSIGSVLRASDINALHTTIAELQSVVWHLSRTIGNAFCVRALATPAASVKIQAGYAETAIRNYVLVPDTTLDFSTGDFQLTAITAGYSRALLITVDQDGEFHCYEGEDYAEKSSAVFPFTSAFHEAHASERFLAVVLVTDAGSGTAGDILSIEADDISDLRGSIPPPLAATYFKVEDGWPWLWDIATSSFKPVALNDGAFVTLAVATTTTTTTGA